MARYWGARRQRLQQSSSYGMNPPELFGSGCQQFYR